ncbi:MAG: hypothetical protein LUQ31_06320 [Methanoregula sp.]|nr:hypothetical protein [Methanoregula sp.]
MTNKKIEVLKIKQNIQQYIVYFFEKSMRGSPPTFTNKRGRDRSPFFKIITGGEGVQSPGRPGCFYDLHNPKICPASKKIRAPV